MNGLRALFIDIETTGLRSDDRIVSLGAISADLGQMMLGEFDIEYCYLIFDPGKRSHPKAEAVHGFDDWLLRHQRYFHEEIETIVHQFSNTDILVGHNLNFDLGFLSRQLEECGYLIGQKKTFCTMVEYRDQFEHCKAGLQFAARRFGLKRTSKAHSAIEDAWLAMGVFAGLQGWPFPKAIPTEIRMMPANLIQPLPRPCAKLPARKPFKASLPPTQRRAIASIDNDARDPIIL